MLGWLMKKHSMLLKMLQKMKLYDSKRLATGDKEYQLSKDIVNSILSMDRLAKILRRKRMNHGAISFDTR